MTEGESYKTLPLGNILPHNTRAEEVASAALEANQHPIRSVATTRSYDEAAAACKTKVEKISKECRRFNRKYRDSHFDLGLDTQFCISSLLETGRLRPAVTKRVHDIFTDPVFFKDGVSAGDIKQGAEGDCWFLAAIATVGSIPGLVEKICVARDEMVGVYGFVFLRDGEWCSVIVDDQLYLKYSHFDDAHDILRMIFEGKEQVYTNSMVTGSGALLCASCADSNETWLPIMEKAYAKIHGDYNSISGGFSGEAVEDLTGGVTTEILSCDIMDKDLFWKEGLLKANTEFLFAAGITPGEGTSERQGVVKGHAYSVLKAVEANGERLLLLRNPWGQSEWTGAWSDGSKEWTAEWMKLLNHRQGDDGQFYMSYKDFLRKFDAIDRTRLFDETWKVTENKWVNYHVPWSSDYAKTRYEITVNKETPAVIVLSQLDTRYFKGLEGRYQFRLRFRVHKDGEEDYLTCSYPTVFMKRSTNIEINLEPGCYTVMFRVEPIFLPSTKKMLDIVKDNKNLNRKKFRQIAMNADLAHAKAGSTSFWREADLELIGDDCQPDEAEQVEDEPTPDDEEEDDSKDEGKEDTEEEEESPEYDAAVLTEMGDFQWNAKVCVGLKVYSKDDDLTVQIVEPNPEDGADLVDLDDPNLDIKPEDSKELDEPNKTKNDDSITGKMKKKMKGLLV